MARQVAIQPDGKILVAGTVWNTDYDFVLLRYNTNGTLDNTFGTNGIKIIDLGGWDFGYALAGGRMRITDDNGIREVDIPTGSSFSSAGVKWHEVFNTGETTVVYLIFEPK